MLRGILHFVGLIVLSCTLAAQDVRIRAAAEVSMPASPDCNSPAFWRDGRLFWYGSHGSPWLSTGPDQFGPFEKGAASVPSSDISPKWIESVFPESSGVVWGWYHAEPVNLIPDSTLTAPKIGAAVSFDGGYTMNDLGFVLEAGDAIDPTAQNGYFAGGHGDFTVVLDRQRKYFYFFFGNYGGAAESQGVCIARMAYEDRANPSGKVWKYFNGEWKEAGQGGRVTPVFPVRRAWQSRYPDAFWGPSVHWNTYLNCYVMLLNHAAGERWAQEGVYVSFCADLTRPETWTTPRKILDRASGDFTDPGDYYAQVMGLEAGDTDRRAGQVARLYLHGVSKWEIEFVAPEIAPANVDLVTHPSSGAVTAGDVASLSVAAMGQPPFTYQWLKNGLAIPGATSATLSFNPAATGDTGLYQVLVSNQLGAAASNAVTFTVTPVPESSTPVPPAPTPAPSNPTPRTEAFLSNLSVRAWLSPERPELTVGFAVQSAGSKPLVIRAVGPALGLFGVADAATNPRLDLFDSSAQKIGENEDWLASDAAAFTAVGAFPFSAGSADAALAVKMPVGPSTARLGAAGGGSVLAEIYDPAPSDGAKVINLSTLAEVGSGSRVLAAGFTISGTGSKRVLIRALGPQLELYGVTSALKDPVLEVFAGSTLKIAENDDWNAALEPQFTEAGAAALNAGSRDAAVVLTLPAGNFYSVIVRSADGTVGDALLEVFELPSR